MGSRGREIPVRRFRKTAKVAKSPMTCILEPSTTPGRRRSVQPSRSDAFGGRLRGRIRISLFVHAWDVTLTFCRTMSYAKNLKLNR